MTFFKVTEKRTFLNLVHNYWLASFWFLSLPLTTCGTRSFVMIPRAKDIFPATKDIRLCTLELNQARWNIVQAHMCLHWKHAERKKVIASKQVCKAWKAANMPKPYENMFCLAILIITHLSASCFPIVHASKCFMIFVFWCNSPSIYSEGTLLSRPIFEILWCIAVQMPKLDHPQTAINLRAPSKNQTHSVKWGDPARVLRFPCCGSSRASISEVAWPAIGWSDTGSLGVGSGRSQLGPIGLGLNRRCTTTPSQPHV